MGKLIIISSVIATVLLVAYLIDGYSLSYPNASEPCQIRFKCSVVRDLVWATEASNCFVFQNACILANENCQRRNRNEPELMGSQESCQNLCSGGCTREFRPQCAIYYNNRNQTFPNRCELLHKTCIRADPYALVLEGECDNL